MGGGASKQATRRLAKVTTDSVARPSGLPGPGNELVSAKGASNRPPASTVTPERDEAVIEDGRDPQLIHMMRELGPVQYKDPSKRLATPRNDPLQTMFANRQRLHQEQKDLVSAEVSGTLKKKHIEMSEVIAILNARKAGANNVQITEKFDLEANVMERLGEGVNTVTPTGETDDAGNLKGTW